MKLYRSAMHPQQWVACAPETGWMTFPARQNGWEQRRPVRGLDPLHLRAAAPQMAADTGFPQSEEVPEYAGAA